MSFNISETEHTTKKLTTDIAITLKVLMDKSKRNILPYSFNINIGFLSGLSAVLVRIMELP